MTDEIELQPMQKFEPDPMDDIPGFDDGSPKPKPNCDARAQWYADTLAMLKEQGYRATPVFKDRSAKPYANRQTYYSPADYRDAVMIGVVLNDAVLVDIDGNKDPAGVNATLARAVAELGEDGLGMLVQQDALGVSLHYLADGRHFPEGLKHSCDGWLDHVDIKRGNQLMHLKPGKIIIDSELPKLDKLPKAHGALVKALGWEVAPKGKDAPDGNVIADVVDGRVIDAVNAFYNSAETNLHKASFALFCTLRELGCSKKSTEALANSLSHRLAQLRGKDRARQWIRSEVPADIANAWIYAAPITGDFDPVLDGDSGEGEANVHPLAAFIDPFGGDIEETEMVIDEFVQTGTCVFAGPPGIGKTSNLLPMACAVAGILAQGKSKLTAEYRRKVVYITEDTGQLRRILRAMINDGLINPLCNPSDWLYVAEAKRMAPKDIAKVTPTYLNMIIEAQHEDGHGVPFHPLVVADTSSATIQLDNENDNSEVANAVATLRQAFGPISMWIVAHVAKSTRKEIDQMTIRGASAWEGDAQQTVYFGEEDGIRFMRLGKKRFETPYREAELKSHVATLPVTKKLGGVAFEEVRYALANPVTPDQKAALVTAKKEADAQNRISKLCPVVHRYVFDNPGTPKVGVVKGLKGRTEDISNAIDNLIESGVLRVEMGGKTKTAKLLYAVTEPISNLGTASAGEPPF